MEIRRSKAKPCRTPKSKNKIFLFDFIFTFVENKHFENYTYFIYLIKGTILGRTLWGAYSFSVFS